MAVSAFGSIYSGLGCKRMINGTNGRSLLLDTLLCLLLPKLKSSDRNTLSRLQSRYNLCESLFLSKAITIERQAIDGRIFVVVSQPMHSLCVNGREVPPIMLFPPSCASSVIYSNTDALFDLESARQLRPTPCHRASKRNPSACCFHLRSIHS
jgi:hypothetical protein